VRLLGLRNAQGAGRGASNKLYARVNVWPLQYHPTPILQTRAREAVGGELSWEEETTFELDRGARRIVVQLYQSRLLLPPLLLGTALVPTPPPEAPVVSVLDRLAAHAIPGLQVAWFPVGSRTYSDYSSSAAEADYHTRQGGWEVHVSVSFAQRSARSGYCEAIRVAANVAQPVDSWSNAAFALTGLHMLFVAAKDLRTAAPPLSGMERFAPFSALNGLTQLYAGASSFLFHASVTALGQRLDMAGVYMLVVSPSLYLLQRLGLFGPPTAPLAHALLALTAAGGAYGLFRYKWLLELYAGGSMHTVLFLVASLFFLGGAWLFLAGSPCEEGDTAEPPPSPPAKGEAAGPGAMGLLWRALCHRLRHPGGYDQLRRTSQTGDVSQPSSTASLPSDDALSDPPPPSSTASLLAALRPRRRRPAGLEYRLCGASLLAIAAAFVCRELDVRWDVACYPHSFFQLHALWHVLAAASLWFLWLFLRSERPAPPPPPPKLRLPSFGPPMAATAGLAPLSLLRRAATLAASAADARALGAAAVASPRGVELTRAASIREDGELLSGMEGGLDTPVGVPAATGRGAQHLRTRSREVFSGASDMV